MSWHPYDGGQTIGQRGSEDGVILRDEEHELGARITLERECISSSAAITCGVYGWFFHTRFFKTEAEGEAEFADMKNGLAGILDVIPFADNPNLDARCALVGDAISQFVNGFP